MPRVARIYSEFKVYHVTIRGIDKQNIFFDEKDRYKFLNLIKKSKEKYDHEIYVYCLMDNHVHLVMYDKENQLSKIMQSIEISYAIYFNKKYNRVGHLFQNRFFSKKVEDTRYLLQLCRYIHHNPLKAQIEKTENYKWSSYKEYIGTPKIVNSTFLLLFFSKNIKKAKEEFVKFHNIDSDEDKETEIKNIFEYELCEKFTDQEVEKYICELFNIDNVYDILQYNNKIRNEKFEKLKCFKNVPISQLSRVIGVNRKMLERTIKKEHMSQMEKNVQKETSLLDTEVNDGKK